jgi:hypothetical protein
MQVGACRHLETLLLMATPVTDAGLPHLGHLQNLQTLFLGCTHVSDAGLPALANLRNLENLWLDHTAVCGTGLASLQHLPHLRLLDLEECPLSHDRVGGLKVLTGLRELRLARAGLTDDCLADVSALPNLESLDLSGNDLNGPGVAALGAMRCLRDLNLSDTGLTDRFLNELGSPGALRRLDVSTNYLTDDALDHLARLANLEDLDLHLTFISDDGLAHLKALPRLAQLSLEGTDATDAGVRHLRTSLPSTNVDFSGDPQPHILSAAALRAARHTAAANTPPVELELRENPPITPRCNLDTLGSPTAQRHYLACNLNPETGPQYLIESSSGAHGVGFVPVDRVGRPLVARAQIGEIGNERILILSTRHQGYYDIACSDCDGNRVSGELWQFDGRRYVVAHSFEFAGDGGIKAGIEELPGAVQARWYCDMFSRPRHDDPPDMAAWRRGKRVPTAPRASVPASAPGPQ